MLGSSSMLIIILISFNIKRTYRKIVHVLERNTYLNPHVQPTAHPIAPKLIQLRRAIRPWVSGKIWFLSVLAIFYIVTGDREVGEKCTLRRRDYIYIFFSSNFSSIFLKFGINMKVLKGSVVKFFQIFQTLNMTLKWTLNTLGSS